MAKPRNYRKEYDDYHGSALQLKRRTQRNAARNKLAKEGRVSKGDGKDVDHKNRNKGGNLSNSKSNLRVQSRSKNRARNSHGQGTGLGSKQLALTDCTDKQRKFLEALQDEKLQTVEAHKRFRHCAREAGYSDATNLQEIMRPIRHLVIEAAEAILMDASISAAMVIVDTVNGTGIDSIKTKFQMDAAKELLDRAVPKKEVNKATSNVTNIVLQLPQKAVLREIEDHE